jgi:hypothetical protein
MSVMYKSLPYFSILLLDYRNEDKNAKKISVSEKQILNDVVDAPRDVAHYECKKSKIQTPEKYLQIVASKIQDKESLTKKLLAMGFKTTNAEMASVYPDTNKTVDSIMFAYPEDESEQIEKETENQHRVCSMI